MRSSSSGGFCFTSYRPVSSKPAISASCLIGAARPRSPVAASCFHSLWPQPHPFSRSGSKPPWSAVALCAIPENCTPGVGSPPPNFWPASTPPSQRARWILHDREPADHEPRPTTSAVTGPLQHVCPCGRPQHHHSAHDPPRPPL